jgi:RNA polymerase sigma-70 factor (ECF subfamily)
MYNGELIPHLFRTEYRKIISVLCRHFGFDQIEAAEDIASDTFLTAAQTWGLNGHRQRQALLCGAKQAKTILKRNSFLKTRLSPKIKRLALNLPTMK